MSSAKSGFRTQQVSFRSVILLALLVMVFRITPWGRLAIPGGNAGKVYASLSILEGDIDNDGDVDLADFAFLASHWLQTNCNEPGWCNGADLDYDNSVDPNDLFVLARNWLVGKSGDLSTQNINSYPTRLALGPNDELYVSDAKAGAVFIYDAELNLIGELKGLAQPLGVAVDTQGKIYVGNNGRDNVEVYSAAGAKIAVIGEGIIKMPTDLALDRNGRLYVADSLNNTVWVYGSDGSAIGSIGAAGDGDGEFRFPVAVTVAYYSDGNELEVGQLYVADQGHATIQVFDLQGNFLRSFGEKVSQGMIGWSWKGKFVRLQSLLVDGLGQVHAADCYMNKIQILDAETGGYIDSYGSFGTAEGQLNLPLDIVITSSGQVVVANAENKRVEIIYTMP